MALQHFYSRVPARMSIFNRTDSFDTFAFSSGLEREFIEKELAPAYDNKPSKNDAPLIRTGKLKPVYCQYFTKSGRFVQSCTSYLPLDYTGERSAYFTHTLIPDEAEEKELLYNPDNSPLNPDMFKKNLDEFNLTDEKAKPDTEYPPIKYQPVKAGAMEDLLKYDSAMMKRLIFAMLNLACGKGKNIFVSMPFKPDTFSEDSLGFISSLLQIFPYHIRRAFSFVTYTDGCTGYNNFNLKFISEGAAEVPPAKGMTLHFGSKIAIGLSDEMVVNNNQIVEFFYNLIKNDALRRRFLEFIETAVETEPALRKANLKAMTELVFLFEQCSGLYNEKAILPTDARVYDFICAYDKHRNALSDDYRAKALTCLKRYNVTHTMIPKEIFQKVNKIYPTEPFESKKVIMEIVLEMIHTDLMREKLFSFVKANYSQEIPEMQSEIMLNLCRVYYGGFLQPQILGFFEENFSNAGEEARNMIVDKLLLTIRTPSVRDKIIGLFDTVYEYLTTEQKLKLFETFYEMLPEADQLTVALLTLIDKHIVAEDNAQKQDIADNILKCILNDERFENPKLLAVLLSTTGFCASAVAVKILSSCSEDEIFAKFVTQFKAIESNADKIKLLDNIWSFDADISVDTAKRWAEMMCEIQKETPSSFGLFDLIEYDKLLSAFVNCGEAKEVFARLVLDGYIRPLLSSTVPKIITAKLKPETFNSVIAYSSDKEYITGTEQYKPVEKYVMFYNAAKEMRYGDMVEAAAAFEDKTVKAGVAEHLKANITASKDFDGEEYEFTKILTKFLLSFLQTGEMNFFDNYSANFAHFTEKMFAQGTGADRETVEIESAKKSIECTVEIANIIFKSADFSDYRTKIFAANDSLYISLSGFSSKVKRFEKYIEELISQKNYASDFSGELRKMTAEIQKSNGGFLKKLFKK